MHGLARVAAIAATVALLGGASVVLEALPAEAAAPPQALGECKEPAPRGGWDFRDMVATGTNSGDPAPVRKRSLRLAEPCYEGFGSAPDPFVVVPMLGTEVPVPMLDEDEDGVDDGAPEVGEPEFDESACVTFVTTLCVSIIGDVSQRWAASAPARFEYRWWCLSVVGDTSGRSMWAEWAPHDAGSTFPTFGEPERVAWDTWDAAVVSPYTGPVGGSGGAYTPNAPQACPAGTTHTLFAWTRNSGTVWPQPPSNPLRIGVNHGTAMPATWVEPTPPMIGDNYYGGTQSADYIVGAGEPYAPGPSSVTCASDYGGTVGRVTDTFAHMISQATAHALPAFDEGSDDPRWSGVWPVSLAGVTASSCPYLVSVELWVCVWVGQFDHEYSCTLLTWDADRWASRYSYGEEKSPEEYICELYPSTVGCWEYLHGFTDGTDWDTACGANWPHGGGLPEIVGHLAVCLFKPLNGWDANGDIARAIESSAIGELGQLIEAGASELTFAPGCGLLVDDEDGMTGLALDTCSWQDWAPTVYNVIYWGLLLGFLYWAIRFLVDTTLSVVNRRTPNPAGEGE